MATAMALLALVVSCGSDDQHSGQDADLTDAGGTSKSAADVDIPADHFNVGSVSGVAGDPCTLALGGGLTSCTPGTADGVVGPWELTCDVGIGRDAWDSQIEDIKASWDGKPGTVRADVAGPWDSGYFFPQALVVNAWRGNIACNVEAVPDSEAFEGNAPKTVAEAQSLIAAALAVAFDALPEQVEARKEAPPGTAAPSAAPSRTS
ncbi:MAG: hypothetical protein QM655_04995 [Nocardioidaceae bacterium]